MQGPSEKEENAHEDKKEYSFQPVCREGCGSFFAGEWSSKSQPVTKTGKKIRWAVYSGKKVFCLAHVEVPGVGFCTQKSKAVTQVNRSLVP